MLVLAFDTATDRATSALLEDGKRRAAADRLPEHEPLPVVADEFGSPTYTKDVAAAMFELLARTEGGVYHVADTGVASRRDWAERVLAVRRPGRETRPISASEFSRASTPPRWGVLSSARAAALGVAVRDWRVALDDYLGARD